MVVWDVRVLQVPLIWDIVAGRGWGGASRGNSIGRLVGWPCNFMANFGSVRRKRAREIHGVLEPRDL